MEDLRFVCVAITDTLAPAERDPAGAAPLGAGAA